MAADAGDLKPRMVQTRACPADAIVEISALASHFSEVGWDLVNSRSVVLLMPGQCSAVDPRVPCYVHE